MILYHVSPSKNDGEIEQSGLLTSKSRSVARVIWLVGRDLLDWAILHVGMRHDTTQLTLHAASVPKSWLRRMPHGPLTCARDIPPERIKGKLSVYKGITYMA